MRQAKKRAIPLGTRVLLLVFALALSACSGISIQPADTDFYGTDSSHGHGN